ncbi:MAG: hypothetical protein P8L21_04995, partial [Polaribacter sp.]|nr:hypothetical protein [Polaribacter sp.]
MKLDKKFSLIILFITLSMNIVQAQLDLVSSQQIDFSTAVSTIQSGNWTDASIWSNGQVPTANTDVIINNNHTVY